MKTNKKASTKIAVFGYVFSDETNLKKQQQEIIFQREAILMFCKKNKLKAPLIFLDNDKSKPILDRPGFAELYRKIFISKAERKVLLFQSLATMVHSPEEASILIRLDFENEIEPLALKYPEMSASRLRNYIAKGKQGIKIKVHGGYEINIPTVSENAKAISPANMRTRSIMRIPQLGRHVSKNVKRKIVNT